MGIKIFFSELFRKLLNRHDVVQAFEVEFEKRLDQTKVLYDYQGGRKLLDIREVFKGTEAEDNALRVFFKDALELKDNDIKVLIIAKTVNNHLTYRSDRGNYGKVEWWARPYDVMMRKVDDCDGYAVLIFKAMMLAGIPEYRRRLVAGSVVGGGHAYVLYLSEKWNVWCAIEGSYYAEDALSMFVKGTGYIDNPKYKDIWFSTTENRSFVRTT